MTTTSKIGVKHPVIHFEIVGRDPVTLGAFYRDVFGWAIREPMPGDPMQYVTIDTMPGEDGFISGGIGKARRATTDTSHGTSASTMSRMHSRKLKPRAARA